MITAVHVEDEPKNFLLLSTLLQTHFTNEINLVANATTVIDAYSIIIEQKPKLVFLDIELKNGNGFELLEKINETSTIDFEVIFITAYNEYAIKAFRFNAIDYLLKPISIPDLKHAVDKAITKINTPVSKSNNIQQLLQQLTETISIKKIPIPIAEGVEFIKATNIVKIEAKGSYSFIYLTNGKKITTTKHLKAIEDTLPENIFVRIHHAWIINTEHLKKYIKGKGGYVEMDDNTHVPVSVRKKGDLLDF